MDIARSYPYLLGIIQNAYDYVANNKVVSLNQLFLFSEESVYCFPL